MTTAEDLTTAPTTLVSSLATSERHPGLDDALSALGRTLSVIASRPVHLAESRVTQVTSTSLSADDSYWFGTDDGLVGIRRAGAPVLAELLLGLAPHPESRALSPFESRMLASDFLPLTAKLRAVLNPDGTYAGIGGMTGDAAVAALGKHRVLTLLTVAVTAEVGHTGTVQCEVTVAVAAPSSRIRTMGAVTLDDLSGPLGDIPLAVRASLPPTLVPAQALANLRPGSVVTLAATPDTPWLVHASDTLIAAGNAGQSRNRRSVQIELTWRQHPMSEQVLAGIAAAQEAADHTAGESGVEDGDVLGLVGSVPVAVTAVLGQVTMPLRDVVALHTGQVIDLDRELDAPYVISANGTPVAAGELVMVEGRLGVKITSVSKKK